jgi:ATP-dependent RNA helicase DeaD
VELPAGMPKELFQELKKVRVVGQALNISRIGGSVDTDTGSGKYKPDDAGKKIDKSKKRISSPSRRAKPKSVDA